jgi:GTP-binding protein
MLWVLRMTPHRVPLFQDARYVLSAHRLHDLPPAAGPEIAFAGRSNSGKSSAINAIAGRTRLAFVSKTPGRTQQINFFELRDGGFIVDLPGYGYAKVPHEVRAHWDETLSGYLQNRNALMGMVLVMDARHPLTPLDERMLDWFGVTGRPVHVLLTKADKLSRGEATATLAKVRAALARRSGGHTAQLFSSLKKTGIEEAEQHIAVLLGRSPENASPAAEGRGAPE